VTRALETPKRTSPWLYVLLVVVWFALDFALKQWSLASLVSGELRPFIANVISLTLTFNPGAAWGLFSGSSLPLAVFRIVVGVAVLAYLFRSRPKPVVSVALSLICAGALGNGIDSLVDGKVTDMLYSHQLSAVTNVLSRTSFPIFNLADVWVVSGVVLIFFVSFGRKGNAARAGKSVQP
jgi:signal peptidase II